MTDKNVFQCQVNAKENYLEWKYKWKIVISSDCHLFSRFLCHHPRHAARRIACDLRALDAVLGCNLGRRSDSGSSQFGEWQ